MRVTRPFCTCTVNARFPTAPTCLPVPTHGNPSLACYHRRGVQSLSGTLVPPHTQRASSPQRLSFVVSLSASGCCVPYQRTPCRRAMTPCVINFPHPIPLSEPPTRPVHSCGCIVVGSPTLTVEAVVLVTPRTAIVEEQTSNQFCCSTRCYNMVSFYFFSFSFLFFLLFFFRYFRPVSCFITLLRRYLYVLLPFFFSGVHAMIPWVCSWYSLVASAKIWYTTAR